MEFTIKTIGCKVNTYESEKIKNKLIEHGFEYVDVEEKEKYTDLDFYIVNTCSVTHIADKKSRQMLHLAKKYNKNVKVIAIGCLVNSLSVGANANIVEANANTVGAKLCEPTVGASCTSPLDGVDYIFSNKDKDNLPDLLFSIVGAKLREPIVGASINLPHRIRSFIKIQDGCDQYCTYCLIPYLRGHIRSRDENEIIDEIKDHVKNGVKEIVLTGIHISSYGLDTVEVSDSVGANANIVGVKLREPTVGEIINRSRHLSYESEGAIKIARDKLLSLITKIANIKINQNGNILEVERIRLGSLEPRIINEDFIKGLPSKFCPSFALSLQSGCDKTLKKMNRHYTTKDFENTCDIIRKYMPISTITADVIVGFPGETEEDFEESLSFVKKIRFYNPNIFPYSKRNGTIAAKMDGQLTKEEKHERAVKMIKECEVITMEIENEINDAKIKNNLTNNICENNINEIKEGQYISGVLIEEIVEENGTKYAVGYTKEYIKKKIKL